MTKSYSLLSAPLASMINLSSIVWCIFFESLVLQTLPDTGSMIGYGLMIVGLIYLQVLTFYGEKRSSAKIE
ncbi:MAG: hypothetical protein FJZ58_04245 [Chlamydiae bacterium]|nr:hypothetical protein [Chlamydiota bacterium]